MARHKKNSEPPLFFYRHSMKFRCLWAVLSTTKSLLSRCRLRSSPPFFTPSLCSGGYFKVAPKLKNIHSLISLCSIHSLDFIKCQMTIVLVYRKNGAIQLQQLVGNCVQTILYRASFWFLTVEFQLYVHERLTLQEINYFTNPTFS